MHNHARGALYAVEGATCSFPHTRGETIALLRAGNDFLGTKVNLNDDPALDNYLPPGRLGVPAAGRGVEFLERLIAFYRPQDLLKSLPQAAGGFDTMLPIPGFQHPLQMLLLHWCGRTAPLMSTLRRPKPDRRITRALLWSGGTLYGQMELEAVQHMLLGARIACDVVGHEDQTAERFRSEYEDGRYDLIWVTSHGEYDHWSPHTMELQVCHEPQVRIPLRDLVRMQVPKRDDGRRLLILNICDGGTAATLGGLQRLGTAAMLAGPCQAVVSHMWPVDQLSITLFAALLARSLGSDPSFFAAFVDAAGTMPYVDGGLIEELREALPPDSDLPRRLLTTSVDFQNVHHWGSPVFYQ